MDLIAAMQNSLKAGVVVHTSIPVPLLILFVTSTVSHAKIVVGSVAIVTDV